MALDVRTLAEAFPPTTTSYSTEGIPSKSAASVVVPAGILSDLRDAAYIQKMRAAALAKVVPRVILTSTLTSAPNEASPAPSISTPKSFADLLRSDAHKGQLQTSADNHTYTTNDAGAYSNTGDSALDAFYSLGAWSDGKEVHNRLKEAWEQDPDFTLKLIFNMRSIHEGKNSRELFFHAFGWLYKEHPVSAVGNLDQLVAKVCEDPRNVAARKKWEELKRENGDVTNVREPGETQEEAEFVERPARSHGCWKDLLSVLSLAFRDKLGDPDMDPEMLKDVFGPAPRFVSGHTNCDHPDAAKLQKQIATEEWQTVPSRHSHKRPVEVVQKVGELHLDEWKDKAKERRHDQHATMTSALDAKLAKDPKFRSLYVAVARLFGDALVKDIQALLQIVNLQKSGVSKEAIASEVRKLGNSISLAAKWAPSANKSFDRQYLMTSAIAEVLFPFNGSSDSPDRVDQAHTARGMLRRYVLTPLRNFIAVPEANMHPGKWGQLAYSRVPAVCFTSNKALFWHHDGQRFVAHLEAVGKGKKTISGASLLPHEILITAMDTANSHPEAARRGRSSPKVKGKGKMVKSHLERKMKDSLGKLYSGIYDAQWKSMVEQIAALGALENCIAVCDVSGSMGSVLSVGSYVKGGKYNKAAHVMPIFPAIALSIIVAQVAASPWKNMFITFSSHPELVELLDKSPDGSPAGLAEIATAMSHADWGQNTNFTSVFLNLLLPTAKRNKLAKDQMVKRVFVFSDMQFDAARSTYGRPTEWKTAHQAIKEEFTRAGYDMPELVYWNLAGGRYNEGMGSAAPVNKDEEGVSLMSGFSGSMLKAFVGEDVAEETMEDEVKEVTEWDDADVELEHAKKAEKAERATEKPADKMKKVLSAKSYAGIRLYD